MTSKAEYEAAAERHATAWAAMRAAREVLELAEEEYNTAEAELCKHEYFPGIPSYAVAGEQS